MGEEALSLAVLSTNTPHGFAEECRGCKSSYHSRRSFPTVSRIIAPSAARSGELWPLLLGAQSHVTPGQPLTSIDIRLKRFVIRTVRCGHHLLETR